MANCSSVHGKARCLSDISGVYSTTQYDLCFIIVQIPGTGPGIAISTLILALQVYCHLTQAKHQQRLQSMIKL